MTSTLRFASTVADHEAIYRLRYEIYVEEWATPSRAAITATAGCQTRSSVRPGA